MLAGMEKPHGARPTAESRDVTPLSDLGITPKQVHRWQAVAHHFVKMFSIGFRTFGNFLTVRSRPEFDS